MKCNLNGFIKYNNPDWIYLVAEYSTILRITGNVLSSDSESGHRDIFSWFSSGRLGKCRGHISNEASTASFYILCTSWCGNHPAVPQYAGQNSDSVVKWTDNKHIKLSSLYLRVQTCKFCASNWTSFATYALP